MFQCMQVATENLFVQHSNIVIYDFLARNTQAGGEVELMAARSPEQDAAVGLLRELVRALGFSHVVYLLAQLADEQGDVARARDDAAGATRAAHDAKVLGDTAMRLLG